MPMRLRGSESVCSYSGKIFYLTEIRTLAIYISYITERNLMCSDLDIYSKISIESE